MLIPRITDSQGGVHTATTLVHVYDRAALDIRLQGIWHGFKDALRSRDVTRAATFVHPSRRATYEAQLEVGFAGAQYELLRQRDGRTLSFAIWFQLDVDGIWRLLRF